MMKSSNTARNSSNNFDKREQRKLIGGDKFSWGVGDVIIKEPNKKKEKHGRKG